MRKSKKQKRIIFFVILTFFFLFPVIYMVISSVYAGAKAGLSLMSYYTVFFESPGYLVKFWRSILMCIAIAAGQTIISCMAGTAFAKYHFIGKKFFLVMMALFMILPVQVTLLPNYLLLEKLGFLNSWKALIIPAIFSPFGVIWLTFIIQSLPNEWIEAARLDRANQLQIVRYIIVPEIKPAVVTLFVLTFVESWNMVEQPIIFLEGPQDYPLSVFLAGITGNSIGVQSVCGILCLIPVTFLFLYYRKELTDGLQDTLWSS